MPSDPWPDDPISTAESLCAEVNLFADTWRGNREALAAIPELKVLAQAHSVAVVTGQQPAVGGGPLYSLVKAAHACAVAAQLRQGGVLAVPVFWSASEDHDIGEANHADLVRADGSIQRVTADLGPGRASLRYRSASMWWEALVTACQQSLRGSLGAAWLESMRPADGEGMGAWQCRLFQTLFSRHGLVCVEAHRLRSLWIPTVDRLIHQWPAAALEDQRQTLLAAGHHDAFGPLVEAPFFYDDVDGRVAVSGDRLRHVAQTSWAQLSPGAAVRPILQQAALPAAISIVGPGELAYHRFIAPVYDAAGVDRPRLVPRCSLTLVPSWIERAVQHQQTSVDAVMSGASRSLESAIAATSPSVLTELDRVLADLRSYVERSDRTGSTEKDENARIISAHRRLQRERDRLARSLEKSHRRQQNVAALGTVRAWLRPRSAAQERTMSLFQALWEYGPGLTDEMVTVAGQQSPTTHGMVRLSQG